MGRLLPVFIIHRYGANAHHDSILSADLVIAVFPEEPSRWQIAEAELGYFEQKLLPIVIDTGNDKIGVIEPFSEPQVRKISKPDLENKTGESIERLLREVKEKLGEESSTDTSVRDQPTRQRELLWRSCLSVLNGVMR